MPDYLDVALDDGPGGFAPRKDLASPEAIVRLRALEAAAREVPPVAAAYREARDPKKKAKRKAARAARRRNR